MKYYSLIPLFLAMICAVLWTGLSANMAAAFISQIFFVVFLLFFAAALDPSAAL